MVSVTGGAPLMALAVWVLAVVLWLGPMLTLSLHLSRQILTGVVAIATAMIMIITGEIGKIITVVTTTTGTTASPWVDNLATGCGGKPHPLLFTVYLLQLPLSFSSFVAKCMRV